MKERNLFMMTTCLLLLMIGTLHARLRLDVEGDAKIRGKLNLEAETANIFIGQSAGSNIDGVFNTCFTPPTAIVQGKVINLINNNGTIAAKINATDFIITTTTTCSQVASISFSPTANESEKSYDCGMIGTNLVDIYVTDINSNQTKVSTYVIVQDAFNLCNGGTSTNCSNDFVLHNGLATALANNGNSELHTAHFTQRQLVNCAGAQVANFANLNAPIRIFDLNDLGTAFVEIDLLVNNQLVNKVQTFMVVNSPMTTNTCIPVPIVHNGLIVNLTGSGTIAINAATFNVASYSQCGGGFVFSFSSDSNDNQRTFNCSNLGIQSIDIWITDTQTGSQNKVEVFVQIEDYRNACTTCSTPPTPVIGPKAVTLERNTGTITLNASDFNIGSFASCGDIAAISFSANINDIQKTLDCNNVGTQIIDIFLTDTKGNQSNATTFITVQDNLQVCSNGTSTICFSNLQLNGGLSTVLSSENEVVLNTSHFINLFELICVGSEIKFASTNSAERIFTSNELGFQTTTIQIELDGQIINEVQTYAIIQEALSNSTCIPIPIVHNGLTTAIDPDGMVTINAKKFDVGSFSECGGEIVFSFSEEEVNNQKTFDCSNIGTNFIEVWVTDLSTGSQNKVETFIQITNNDNICSNGCIRDLSFEENETITAGTYQATETVTIKSIVNFSENLTLKAGTQISLLTGTHILPNSNFLATIEACSNSSLMEASISQIQSSQRTATTEAKIISDLSLSIYPNPFQDQTIIEYTLDSAQIIGLYIYNLNGQLVKTLEEATWKEIGHYRHEFRKDDLPSGIYLLT